MQQDSTHTPSKLPSLLAAIFLLCSMITTGIMSTQMPPYQNPDEFRHFLRADQVSHLDILPRRLSNGATGALVDNAIATSAIPFLAVAANPNQKVTRFLYESTAGASWDGLLAPVAFPNTAIYPPAFYLPAVAAIWIGKATHVPVIHTLYGARLINGTCAALIAALAITLAGGAALWLFVVLTLPMSLSLFCAVSQDGMMIACTALATAILVRARRSTTGVSDGRFVLLCLLLTIICMARPPYVPLACLVLATPWRSLRLRLAGLALIALAVASWSLIVLRAAGPDSVAPFPNIDPGRQLVLGLQQPIRMLHMVWDTLDVYGTGYLRQLVGRFGALDVPLPEFVYHCAWSALALVAAHAIVQTIRSGSFNAASVLLTLACCLASVVLILGIQYLTFSPVESPYAEGVQGRYFIEVLLFLGVALCSPGTSGRLGNFAISLTVASCPAVYLSQIVRATMLRYYF